MGGAAIENGGSNFTKLRGQFVDDPSDTAANKIGIDLYKSQAMLSDSTLLWQIYTHKGELNKAVVENGRIIRIYR